MTTFRPKLWTGVSAAILLSSAALAGCGGEGGDTEVQAGQGGQPQAAGGAAPAGDPSAAQPAGEGGEGGSEGAGGEAGAASAYASIPQESRDALRLAHLRGFLLAAQAAQAAEGQEAAAALVGQGLLEVYDPLKVEFTRLGLDEARLRRAAETGAPADINAAVNMINQARGRAGGDAADVVGGMTDIASGLYREVVQPDGLDPVEYQHSHGAALSAQAELERFGGSNPRLQAVRADLQRFLTLWPAPVAPEDPARATPAREVQAQASRIQLALSS